MKIIPLLSENTKLKDAALIYHKAGLSVVPANGKIPIKNWSEYQSRLPTESEIEKWWTENPNANIAVITGSVSGIVVVDVDGVKTDLELPDTFISTTSPGHFHYFYRYPNVKIKTSASQVAPGVDVRGNGGVVIVPPSIHYDANKNPDGQYRWLSTLDIEIAPCPQWLIDYPKNKKPIEKIVEGVEEGSRNSDAASFIGSLLSRYPWLEWESICWPLVEGWNGNNHPPLPEKELRNTFDSIAKRETEKVDLEPEKQNLADQIVDMVLNMGTKLLLNQFGEAYIAFATPAFVAQKIDSEKIKQQLHSIYWSKQHKTIKSESLNNAIATLEGLALEKNDRQYIFNRAAKIGNRIYYDLINQNQIVKITPQGWTIESDCPVYFTRHSHQKNQVTPEHGGDLRELFSFLNLENQESRLLILTYLPVCLVTDIPRVALVLHGDHGSAKSTSLKIIRMLLDPSELLLLTPPTATSDLIQTASHHFILYFDNLSEINHSLSDVLCRLVTGDGFSKRKLYTDNDDIIYSFKTVLGFNGINLVATRADLLDRSLIIKLDRISDSKRKGELEIYKKFEEVKPKLLGSLFDVTAAMLRIEPQLMLNKKPRMADYFGFGTAASMALGYSATEFETAFAQNTKEQNLEAIEASPTAQIILEFIKDKNEWSGSSTALYNLLEPIAANLKYKNSFPKSPTWLWRKIKEIKVNLAALGIVAEKGEGTPGSYIILTKTTTFNHNAATVATTAIQDLFIPTSDCSNGGTGDINRNRDEDKNRKLDLDQDSDRIEKIMKDIGLINN